jgi:spermidine synthase
MEEAVDHWKRALAADQSNGDVHWNLGRALEGLGRAGEALPHLLEAARLKPDDPAPKRQAGLLLLRAGRVDQAAPLLRQAVSLNPNDGEAQDGLGVALLQSGASAEALMHLRQAVALDPRSAASHINLGNALYLSGDIAQALAQWREALRLEPDNVSALTQAAWALATNPVDSARNSAEAVERAARAVKLSQGRNPAALDALAAAYAEAGRFMQAAETARLALAAADEAGSPLAAGIRSRLQLYERAQPFRTSPIPR